jgi:hypothetical protein
MIQRKHPLALALALAAAAGCAGDPGPNADGGGGDGAGGGGLGGGGNDEVERPLSAAGVYRLQSKVDLAASAPGTVGAVVSTIIAMTDDSADPTLWVLDQMISALPSGSVRTVLQNAKPYVAGFLNERILDLAPDFVETAVQLGNDFGQMARQFGLSETLTIAGAPGAYTAKLRVVGARFQIDNVESEHAFAEYNLPEIELGPTVAMEPGGKLEIGAHAFPISYGQVLRVGVDAVLIPMLEPSASNLQELLAAKVSCPLIGAAIASVLPGSAGTYTAACTAGLAAGANYVYGKIAAIDGSALRFELAGTARAFDRNADGAVDAITSGAWAGTVTYGNTPAPLAGATFFGTRK